MLNLINKDLKSTIRNVFQELKEIMKKKKEAYEENISLNRENH